jgi:hypothetical protein
VIVLQLKTILQKVVYFISDLCIINLRNEEIVMRNIDVPGAKEIFEKQDELLKTFWSNKGYIKAAIALHEIIRDDYALKRMRLLRLQGLYEQGAREWYAKHGTVGEF